MSATPEGKVKDLVKAVLKRFEVYYHMPVQNGMGEPTLDFICCANGYFFAIETKALGKLPTPRQRVTMKKMENSGAFVFVVDGAESLNVVENYLQLIGSHKLS